MKFAKGDRVRFALQSPGTMVLEDLDCLGRSGEIVEVHPGEYDYSVHLDGDGPSETWGANDDDLETADADA